MCCASRLSCSRSCLSSSNHIRSNLSPGQRVNSECVSRVGTRKLGTNSDKCRAKLSAPTQRNRYGSRPWHNAPKPLLGTHLLSSAGGMLMLSPGLRFRFQRPNAGLAAARMVVRVLSVVVIPALAMLTVCCSITCGCNVWIVEYRAAYWICGAACQLLYAVRCAEIGELALPPSDALPWWPAADTRKAWRCAVALDGALPVKGSCQPVPTSWMLVRSASSILSNSSMQQMPRSASTSAPPSSTSSLVTWGGGEGAGGVCSPAVGHNPWSSCVLAT